MSQLAAPAPSASVKAELARRSVAKTFSWRALASLDTLALSFIVLYVLAPAGLQETATAAGVIAALEVPNKLLLYYFHERIWARISWGKRVA